MRLGFPPAAIPTEIAETLTGAPEAIEVCRAKRSLAARLYPPLRPAGNEPAPSTEPRRHQRQSHEDEDHERRPDPSDSPVSGERGNEHRSARKERSDHRACEERPVAGADQDPVERDQAPVQRLQ